MPKKSSGSVADTNRASYSEYEVEEFTIDEEPYYLPIQDEIEVFTAAYAVSYTHLTLPTKRIV